MRAFYVDELVILGLTRDENLEQPWGLGTARRTTLDINMPARAILVRVAGVFK
jgi:hypothetical protein